MALTATIVLSPAGEKLGRKFKATLTIVNDGAVAVNVTGISPFICNYAAGAIDENIPCAQGEVPQDLKVGATSAVRVTWDNIIYQTTQEEHKIGADVFCSNGQTLRPTAVFVLYPDTIVLDADLTKFNSKYNSDLVAAL